MALILIAILVSTTRGSVDANDVWVIGSTSIMSTHSTFIQKMMGEDKKAFSTVFYDDMSQVPLLYSDGTPSVKRIILLGTPKIPSKWKIAQLVDFVSDGGQMLYAISEVTAARSTESDPMRQFLSQFGISISKNPLYDPIQKNEDSSKNGSFYRTSNWNAPAKTIIGDSVFSTFFEYPREETYALELDFERTLFFLSSVLSPQETSFTTNKLGNKIENVSTLLSLVSCFQSRNNGRLSVMSSENMLSDDMYERQTPHHGHGHDI